MVAGTGGGESDSVAVRVSLIGGVTVIAVIIVAATARDKAPTSSSRLPTRATVAV